jgi:beta-1,4-N-acetylglucosaminyltransferase
VALFASCCVLVSGGHTGEMCKIIPMLVSSPPRRRYSPVVCVSAESDSLSPVKVRSVADAAGLSESGIEFVSIPRAREVGQGWLGTIGSTLVAFRSCLGLLAVHQPDLLLCNGPGACFTLVSVNLGVF